MWVCTQESATLPLSHGLFVSERLVVTAQLPLTPALSHRVGLSTEHWTWQPGLICIVTACRSAYEVSLDDVSCKWSAFILRTDTLDIAVKYTSLALCVAVWGMFLNVSCVLSLFVRQSSVRSEMWQLPSPLSSWTDWRSTPTTASKCWPSPEQEMVSAVSRFTLAPRKMVWRVCLFGKLKNFSHTWHLSDKLYTLFKYASEKEQN